MSRHPTLPVRWLFLPFLASFLASCGPDAPGELAFEALQCEGCSWFKGNTHAHTTESDGDASPEYVAGWYKDHGYDFLVLSDHNKLTDPETLGHLMDEGFLLVPGEGTE